MPRYHYHPEDGARDIRGIRITHPAIFRTSSEYDVDTSPLGFARFFSEINRRSGRQGIVIAPHIDHAIRPMLDDHFPDNVLIDGDYYGIAFYAIPAPTEAWRRTTSGPTNARNQMYQVRVDDERSEVLTESVIHVGNANTGPIDYSDPTFIDNIGRSFANEVMVANGRDCRYLGHISLDKMAELYEPPNYAETGVPAHTMPPLAWVFDTFLISPYDFSHTESSDFFIDWLLGHALDIIDGNVTPAEEPEPPEPLTPEEEAERRAARIENTVSSLSTWAQRRDTRAIEVAQQQIDAVQGRINRLLADLTERRLELRQAMIQVETIRQMTIRPADLDLISFRKMMQNGVITGAVASPESSMLTFDTKPLVAFDDRTSAYHLIGAMRIRVNMLTGNVSFANLDRRVDAISMQMQAPHVWSSGEPCLGSFADTIPEFVSRADWLGLIEASIQFIESANTSDSAGKYVHRWPFVANPTEYGLPAYEDVVEPYNLF